MLPSNRPHPRASPAIIRVLYKQTELSRIACGRFEPELRKCSAGHHAASRRALQKALLQKVRFDNLLYGVARFAERRCDRFDSDRASGEGLGYQAQIAPVEGVEAPPIHFQPRQ